MCTDEDWSPGYIWRRALLWFGLAGMIVGVLLLWGCAVDQSQTMMAISQHDPNTGATLCGTVTDSRQALQVDTQAAGELLGAARRDMATTETPKPCPPCPDTSELCVSYVDGQCCVTMRQ